MSGERQPWRRRGGLRLKGLFHIQELSQWLVVSPTNDKGDRRRSQQAKAGSAWRSQKMRQEGKRLDDWGGGCCGWGRGGNKKKSPADSLSAAMKVERTRRCDWVQSASIRRRLKHIAFVFPEDRRSLLASTLSLAFFTQHFTAISAWGQNTVSKFSVLRLHWGERKHKHIYSWGHCEHDWTRPNVILLFWTISFLHLWPAHVHVPVTTRDRKLPTGCI